MDYDFRKTAGGGWADYVKDAETAFMSNVVKSLRVKLNAQLGHAATISFQKNGVEGIVAMMGSISTHPAFEVVFNDKKIRERFDLFVTPEKIADWVMLIVT